MKPLSELTDKIALGIRGLFFDLDDTLTTAGRLTAEAYSSLESLQRSGLLVAAITGRPAGWCDHIARMWPVDAVVGENGALFFRYDHQQRRMVRQYAVSESQRVENRRRLEAVKQSILSQVPGAAVSADQAYREADLAIDFCEDVPALDDEQVQKIVSLFEQAGAQAKISSIHVNGWFGDYDKLSMTRIMMREAFDIDLDRTIGRFIFIGDSPNDAPMFEYFPVSVGVANIVRLQHKMTAAPAFVTDAESGAGFAQLAKRLLSARP